MKKIKKPIYVLGVGLSHAGSACLLRDGTIAFAIEKERLTRRKHDGGNDSAAVAYCLEAEGIRLDDIDLVIQNQNFGMFRDGNSYSRNEPRLIAPHPRVHTISHHLAHAYSAVATSSFEECAVLVIDGVGSCYVDALDKSGAQIPVSPDTALAHLYHEKDSYYTFAGNDLHSIYKDFSEWSVQGRHDFVSNITKHSIGGIYAAASRYVFGNEDDVGKLMGLAPYGRAGIFNEPIFRLEDGRVFVDYRVLEEFKKPARGYSDFKADFQYYADIAHWIQREVENAVLYVARARHTLCPNERLAYAGGVALNAVANSKLIREGPFKDVYIQPAAADNGLAIGCAYFGWMNILGRNKVPHSGTPFLGRSYSKGRGNSLSAAKNLSRFISEVPTSQVEECVARKIAEGSTVAWFLGGAEFGPRSLGHRSILADPRIPGMKDRINRDIKLREDFRPFAPSVLLKDTEQYFESVGDCRYMLTVSPVKKSWQTRVPSIVHRNLTARLQQVDENTDLKYFKLLTEFKKITGISMLINTSLNRRGMPIVETPTEAIKFFVTSNIDFLYLDGRLYSRRKEDVLGEMLNSISESIELNQDFFPQKNNLSLKVDDSHFVVDFKGSRSPAIRRTRRHDARNTQIDISMTEFSKLFVRPGLIDENGGIRKYATVRGRLKLIEQLVSAIDGCYETSIFKV